MVVHLSDAHRALGGLMLDVTLLVLAAWAVFAVGRFMWSFAWSLRGFRGDHLDIAQRRSATRRVLAFALVAALGAAALEASTALNICHGLDYWAWVLTGCWLL